MDCGILTHSEERCIQTVTMDRGILTHSEERCIREKPSWRCFALQDVGLDAVIGKAAQMLQRISAELHLADSFHFFPIFPSDLLTHASEPNGVDKRGRE